MSNCGVGDLDRVSRGGPRACGRCRLSDPGRGFLRVLLMPRGNGNQEVRARGGRRRELHRCTRSEGYRRRARSSLRLPALRQRAFRPCGCFLSTTCGVDSAKKEVPCPDHQLSRIEPPGTNDLHGRITRHHVERSFAGSGVLRSHAPQIPLDEGSIPDAGITLFRHSLDP